MILKYNRHYTLFVALFLMFAALIGLYTSFVNNGEHNTFQSVWYQLQPSKERQISSSDNIHETKKLSNKDVVNKKSVTLRRKAKLLTNTELNNRNIKLKYETKVQTGKGNTTHIGNSKTKSGKCTKKEVVLSQTQMPITGLVSFPGSGNTWTRHLIQQMTGLGTSSVYCDRRLRVRGFPYECQHDKSKTVVVKTHNTGQFKMFSKIVLLLRNPYDAILSFANFKAGHTGHPTENVLIEEISRTFDHRLRWYVSLTRNTTKKFKGPVHVMQYEKLQTNMPRELKKLASFFDLNISDRDIECTVQLQEGNFHRLTKEKKHLELLRAVFSKEKLLRLQETARYSEKMIKDAYNINVDLGGQTEKILLQGF